MSISLADAPSVAPPDRPVRRGRRLPIVLLACGLLLLGYAFVRAAPAAAGIAPVGASYAGQAESATLEAYGSPTGMDVVGYKHGATSEITLTLRNTGWLPMTVEKVTLTRDVAPLLDVRTVTGLPLRLGPGESGELKATAVVGNCRFYHEREASLYHSVELDWSVFGQSRSSVAPLVRPIMVRSPMITGCPDRKLNRQADNRRDVPGAV